MAARFSEFEKKFAHLEEIYLRSLNQWLTFFECDGKYEHDQFEADMEKLALFKIYVFFFHGYQELQRILNVGNVITIDWNCLLYTSPSPRDRTRSRMPSSA